MNKLLTPEFRTSFANVFEPKENLQGKMKYGITMLFPKKTDISAIKDMVAKAAKEKWGDKVPAGLKNPIKDGDDKDYTGFADHWYINASSDYKPGLVDENVQPIISQDGFYSGCYARATINAFAWENEFGKGVGIGVQNIQFLRHGDRLDGRSDPEDDFEAVTASDNPDDLFG